MTDLKGGEGNDKGGEMANNPLKSVYKCCCLTEQEKADFDARMAAFEKKANDPKDLTNYYGQTYDATGHGGTGLPYRNCSGTARDMLPTCMAPSSAAGLTPGNLKDALANSAYCEEAPSSYLPPPPAPYEPPEMFIPYVGHDVITSYPRDSDRSWLEKKMNQLLWGHD